jgi:hypothetical protein
MQRPNDKASDRLEAKLLLCGSGWEKESESRSMGSESSSSVDLTSRLRPEQPLACRALATRTVVHLICIKPPEL